MAFHKCRFKMDRMEPPFYPNKFQPSAALITNSCKLFNLNTSLDSTPFNSNIFCSTNNRQKREKFYAKLTLQHMLHRILCQMNTRKCVFATKASIILFQIKFYAIASNVNLWDPLNFLKAEHLELHYNVSSFISVENILRKAF